MKIKLLFLGFLVITSLIKAQVGINTTHPLGTFHVDGANDNSATPTVAQQANDFIVTPTGTTGIGITNLDPSAKLQIDAPNKGVLIPRVTLTTPTDGTTIPSPAKGLIVYNTNVTPNMEEGFYTNYGTPTSPNWITYQKYDKTAWEFIDVYDTTATAPVNQLVTAGTTINNIDLGMNITVTIPANSQAKLITAYSVPLGTTLVASNSGAIMEYVF